MFKVLCTGLGVNAFNGLATKFIIRSQRFDWIRGTSMYECEYLNELPCLGEVCMEIYQKSHDKGQITASIYGLPEGDEFGRGDKMKARFEQLLATNLVA